MDLTAQIPAGVEVEAMMSRLRSTIADIPNVLRSPAPLVEILSLASAGSTLAVRPFCRNDDYWQVYFDVNHAISQALAREQIRLRAS